MIGSPAYTTTRSVTWGSPLTDTLDITDVSQNVLDVSPNAYSNVLSIFIRNSGDTNNLLLFVGADETGFDDGTAIEPGQSITIDPVGANVYAKCGDALTTTITAIVQESTIPFPPIIT
jgi:hypothetical protein